MADPGFPVGGCGPVRGGHGHPIRVLFGENVCKNESIGSHKKGVRRKFLCVDPPMISIVNT